MQMDSFASGRFALIIKVLTNKSFSHVPFRQLILLGSTVGVFLSSSAAIASRSSRLCILPGWETLWAMSIGPFLFAFIIIAVALFKAEESKGDNSSPIHLSALLSLIGLTSIMMIFLVHSGDLLKPEYFSVYIYGIILSVLAKVALLFVRPRIGRTIPSLVIISVILTANLVVDVKSKLC